MKQTRILMGMPISIEVVDVIVKEKDINDAFSYFQYVDNKFSTYKKDSEISLINSKKIKEKDFSRDMKLILKKAEETKKDTNGYFNMLNNGKYDPSGVVKGWAILNAANLLKERGLKNFYVEAGGDIQVSGKNEKGENWTIGIRNPFNIDQIIKVLSIYNIGVATSGTYLRGQHIYNPKNRNSKITEIVSLTVVGPDVYEADRFATACFAMEKEGIAFIENLTGFEGYLIDKNGIATMTTGFKQYVK